MSAHRRSFRLALVALATCLLSGLAMAQSGPPRRAPGAEGGNPPGNAAPQTAEPLLPADAVTSHSITVGGQEIKYTARAGALALTDDKGAKTAENFYVAYTVDGADPAKRPITFAFNGGPGAASAYLQMGAIGPRVVDFGDGRHPPAGSLKTIDNPDTWLPFTDLVFIDPVGTGYSHAMNSVSDVAKSFWSVQPDLNSLGAAIRLALDKLNRFSSPLYLAGESYGGYRAARLVARLPSQQGINVAGATLLSPVLEFSITGGDDFDPLPWALRLPSETAVHLEAEGKLSADALAPVETFALGDYLTTLASPRGDPRRSAAFYDTVSGDIGLPVALVQRYNGSVPIGIFAKEIDHDKGEVASLYDASVAGNDPYPAAPTPRGTDPIFQGIIAPLTSAFVAYARDELQFRTDRHYILLNNEVARRWDWQTHGPSDSTGASDDMRRALALDPKLKITIDHGMTDLVTPYMTSRYVVDHLPPDLVKDRVTLNLFPGGHMMYLRPGSRAALSADAKAMYQAGAQ